MPILVTGATGYLGRQIMQYAATAAIAVTGTSRSGTEGTIACDLRDGPAVARLMHETGARTIIHCAAMVPKSAASYGDEAAARESLAMVEALCAARPARIVFASSMSVYPRHAAMPVREFDTAEPDTAYGAAKRQAERMLLATPGDGICLRLPGLFGAPRRTGLLYNVADAFADGRVPALDDDPPPWAGLHVEDAADLCLRAARHPGPLRDIVNAGYPGPMSVRSAVGALALRFGCAAPRMAPGRMFEMDLSRLADGIGLPAHSFNQRLAEIVQSVRRAA